MGQDTDSRAANVSAAVLGSVQHGLLTSAQALALGMSRAAIQRRVQSGDWERVRKGVYAFAGAVKSRKHEILEACLAAGPRAVVSGFTAAELWRLPDVWARPGISLTVPPGIRRTVEGAQLRRSRTVVSAHDCDILDGVPMTSVARTYLDLAESLPEHVLERSIVQAIRRGLLEPRDLAAAVERGGAREALEKIEAILEHRAWGAVARSGDELRAHRILRDTGIEGVEQNAEVEYAGIYIGEADLLAEALELIIEIDGPLDHSTEEQRNLDRVRTLAYRAKGLRVLRFPADRLRDPEDFVSAVARELQKPAPARVSEEDFRRLWAQWIARYGDPNANRSERRRAARLAERAKAATQAGPAKSPSWRTTAPISAVRGSG